MSLLMQYFFYFATMTKNKTYSNLTNDILFCSKFFSQKYAKNIFIPTKNLWLKKEKNNKSILKNF